MLEELLATWWLCTCTHESPLDPYETGLFSQLSFLQLCVCEHQVFLKYAAIARYFPTYPWCSIWVMLPTHHNILSHWSGSSWEQFNFSPSKKESFLYGCREPGPSQQVNWANKQQAVQNHTGKLGIHSVFANNKLILQPKTSTFFQIKILQIFKASIKFGMGKQFFHLPSPKICHACRHSQPHSQFLLAACAASV